MLAKHSVLEPWPAGAPFDRYSVIMDLRRSATPKVNESPNSSSSSPSMRRRRRAALCLRGAVSVRNGHVRTLARGVSARGRAPSDYVSFPAAARAYRQHIVHANSRDWDVDIYLHSWHVDIAAELLVAFEPVRAVIEEQSVELQVAWRHKHRLQPGDRMATSQVAQAFSMAKVLGLALSADAASDRYELYILVRPDMLLWRNMDLNWYLLGNGAWVNCWSQAATGGPWSPMFRNRDGFYAQSDLIFTLDARRARIFAGLYTAFNATGGMGGGMHHAIRAYMRDRGADLQEDRLCHHRDFELLLLLANQLHGDGWPSGLDVTRYGLTIEELLAYCGSNRTRDGLHARDCERDK